MRRAVSRRGLLRLGAGLVATATLGGQAGCAGESEAGNPCALRMTWWGGEARTKAYQEALAAFGRSHRRHRGTRRTRPATTATSTASTPTSPAAAPLDLLQMDTALVSEYAGRGMLRPLDEYVGRRPRRERVPERAARRRHGRRQALRRPVGHRRGAGDLRRDDAEDRDAEPPPADWTWPDLAAYAANADREARRPGLRRVGRRRRRRRRLPDLPAAARQGPVHRRGRARLRGAGPPGLADVLGRDAQAQGRAAR